MIPDFVPEMDIGNGEFYIPPSIIDLGFIDAFRSSELTEAARGIEYAAQYFRERGETRGAEVFLAAARILNEIVASRMLGTGRISADSGREMKG